MSLNRKEAINHIFDLLYSNFSDSLDEVFKEYSIFVDYSFCERFNHLLEYFNKNMFDNPFEIIDNVYNKVIPDSNHQEFYLTYMSLVEDLTSSIYTIDTRLRLFDIPPYLKGIVEKYDYYFSGKVKFTIDMPHYEHFDTKGIVFLDTDVLAAADSMRVRVWDLKKESIIDVIKPEGEITTIAALSKGKLAIGLYNGKIEVYENLKLTNKFITDSSPVRKILKGRIIQTDKQIHTAKYTLDAEVKCVDILGNKLLTGCDHFRIWDLDTKVLKFIYGKYNIKVINIVSSNNRIAILYSDNTVQLRDENGKLLNEFINKRKVVKIFLTSNLIIVTSDEINIYNIEDGERKFKIPLDNKVVNIASLLPNNTLILGRGDNDIDIVDLEHPYSERGIWEMGILGNFIVSRNYVIIDSGSRLKVLR